MKVLGQPDRIGTLSIMGAVSPPAGDFSEPVTKYTTQNVRVLWALDKKLADARHYPAINWNTSFSEYTEYVKNWWHEEIDPDWFNLREKALQILTKDEELMQMVKLIGAEALPDNERLILFTSKLLKEGFLRQNALDLIDTYTTPEKQLRMLKLILKYHEKALQIIEKRIPVSKVTEVPVVSRLMKMKITIENEDVKQFKDVRKDLDTQLGQVMEDL
jgi:V/A-type H+-transporting ATPase subunit A